MLDHKQLAELSRDIGAYCRAVLAAAANPPRNASLIFIPGQSPDNQRSVHDAAADFEGVIGIPGYDGNINPGFAGADAWLKELINRQVDSARIVTVVGCSDEKDGKRIANTLTEARGLVAYAKELKDVVLIGTYFHLPRIFLTFVSEARRQGTSTRFYPALGRPLPWDERVAHSQGTNMGTRADFVGDEYLRILVYHAKGDLIHPRDAMQYL